MVTVGPRDVAEGHITYSSDANCDDANVDKGKCTKTLEKETQTGEYEKVQGGYGKYQGTWIRVPVHSRVAADRGVLR
ncbi:Start control cdc10 [Apiospora arundinis]